MLPPTPILALSRLSSSSFSATVAGGSASATHSLYYREIGASGDGLWGSIVGNGSFAPITGLRHHSTYQAWAVGLESGSYSLPSISTVSLADPGDVLGAIHAWWASDPSLSSLVAGGLWTGEVPEGTPYPYAWLDSPSTDSMPNLKDQIEAHGITFHVWAIGAASAESCARAVKSRFDYRTLPSFGDSSFISSTPVRKSLRCENLRDKSGNLVFRSSLTYRILTQLPR